MLISLAPGIQAVTDDAGVHWKKSNQQISIDRSEHLANIKLDEDRDPAQMVRVSIVLEEKSTIEAGFSTLDIASNVQAMAYNKKLQKKQETIEQTISRVALGGEPLDVVWNLTLVGNIISANVPYGKIAMIEKVSGVAGVVLENTYEPERVIAENDITPNQFSATGMSGANFVWSNGYTGAGSRIAVIDTGTDTDHQSFDNGAFLYALEQNALAAGMSLETYMDSLDLLDKEELAAVLPNLNIYQRDNTLTAEKLYLNEKLAFAVNYVDGGDERLHVSHDYDYQGDHGSHVGGIATANRYIPSGDGYVAAMNSVLVSGVAPDAQLITMKVFGNNYLLDSDYMAAIEDAILLGCDSVNLSLGTSVAGAAFNSYYAALLNYMAQTDTVVVASAGNAGTWADMSTFGYPYSDDVVFDTVGAPGSHTNFFTVASVDNDGIVSMAFTVGELNILYVENTGYGNNPLAWLDTSADGSGTAYEYVFVDGIGNASDYEGVDLTGKVVFCSRGETNFSAKANTAVSLGAAAVVVYNTYDDNFGMDLTGYSYTAPVVSVPKSVADYVRSVSAQQTTEAGLTYYTGQIGIYSTPRAGIYNSQYYTMSSFSSWGVPGNLSIKPEITAPGGYIYSIYGSTPEEFGTDQYGLMSGTSMAAPQVTGMVALVAQYLRENDLAKETGLSARVLAQSLLMSTAVPMLDGSTDSYYSVMQQGAGLGRVDLATLAASYILVNGQPDGKVKAELGDDPQRTGVYEFSFTINNLTGTAQDYTLRADLFRQDAFDPGEYSGTLYGFLLQDTWTAPLPGNATFTVNGETLLGNDAEIDCDLNGDGTTDALDADYLLEYLLGNEAELYADGDVNGDSQINTYDAHYLLAMLESGSVLTVPADGSVTVEVKLTLTEEAKATLEAQSADGAYVQAYVFAEEVTEDAQHATNHSIPVLAFYGNWTDPNMFDRGTYVELVHGISDGAPYLYQVIGNGNALTISYGDNNEYYFGGNPLLQDDTYLPERNAFNSVDDSFLLGQYFTLIRNAGDARIQIVNKETGEVYFSKHTGEIYPAFYNYSYGYWDNVQQGMNLFWTGTDASGNPLPEDTVVEVIFTAAPEYYRKADGTYDYDALGRGASLVTQMTIDNTAPEVSHIALEVAEATTLTVTAQDNQYIAAVALMNASGTIVLAAATPNQTTADMQLDVALDLTSVSGKTFLLAVYDYACNVSVYEIELELPEIERPYFTVVDYQNGIYYGLNADGTSVQLAVSDRPMIMAAEFVDGYVFEVSEGNRLYVANDADLNSFKFLRELDPNNYYAITNFLDLAYNYADGKLYGLFYSDLNYEETPVLCTIDMHTGYMEPLVFLPVDVNNMAIDGEGNFYSASYGNPYLYTYTLEDAFNGVMTYVGEMGYYGTGNFNSLAWDHNTDTLYWAFPNTLLEINPETAEPTLLSYFMYNMVGLYIRPETYSGELFAPVEEVLGVELSHYETRTLVGRKTRLTASVWPWNVTDDSVTWTSADESIATVNQNGVVTGVSVGTTVITATSNLDPTKSASCTVEIMTLDKTLNGLVWDEVGQIWWSEFDVNGLPNYTKLNDTPVEEYLASAAFTPDGTLYASTTDVSTGYIMSSLFTVDPETFALTKIGDSQYGYTDIAYAPHLNGGSIMGTYGSNLMVVDPTTGEMYGYFNMFMYGLTAIAYAGSDIFQDYGFDTYIDWFFLIDAQGFVYLMGFLANDAGALYYLEHPATTEGVFTIVDFETDMLYFSSAHYDGEFLYWSVYHEQKNISTLFAIDTAGNREAYNLGNFGDGIWPAGALIELDNPTAGMGLNHYEQMPQPKAVDNQQTSELTKLSVSQPAAPAAEFTPNAAISATIAELLSVGQKQEENEQFVVQVTAADVATNGTMQITYDPTVLSLVSVTGTTEAFAYATGNGTVDIAFAQAQALEADEIVATVTFDIVANGDTTVTVTHGELNQGTSGKVEKLPVPGDAPEYSVSKADEGDWTMSLDSVVYLNLYLKLEGFAQDFDFATHGGVVVWNGEGAVTSREQLYVGSDACITLEGMYWNAAEGKWYVRSPEIFAKNLGDMVYMRPYVEVDGQYVYGPAYFYSPANYCYDILNNLGEREDTRAVCAALLQYAAQAQVYFDYKTDALVTDIPNKWPNIDLSQYDLAYNEDYIDALPTTSNVDQHIKDLAATLAGNRVSVTHLPDTLDLQGAIRLSVRYSMEKVNIDWSNVASAKVLFWNEDAMADLDALTVENANHISELVYDEEAGVYKALSDHILAKNLGEVVYFSVCIEMNDGTIYRGGLNWYSPEAFVADSIVGGSGATEVCKAIAVYSEMARRRFG